MGAGLQIASPLSFVGSTSNACWSYAKGETMKKPKFVVKVSYGDTRAPQYVRRIDRSPILMTTDRKLALVMGKFTAEDAAKSIRTQRQSPELVPIMACAG
jgi:hypothetical protein